MANRQCLDPCLREQSRRYCQYYYCPRSIQPRKLRAKAMAYGSYHVGTNSSTLHTQPVVQAGS